MPIVYEAAEDDVRRSRQAEDLMHAVISFLYKRERRLPTIHHAGIECPYLSSAMLPPAIDENFAPILIIFCPETDSYVGRATKIHSSFDGGYTKYALILAVDIYDNVADLTPENIYGFMCRDRARATFMHEAQHILDYQRSKKKPKPEPEPTDGTTTPIAKTDLKVYFNNPAELNAYYHNLAEPLLSRIRFAQKHCNDDPEIFNLYDHIYDDFKDYLASRIRSISGTYRAFWDNLTDQNKRKIIVRMQKLYTLYQETQTDIRNRISQKWKEEDAAHDQLNSGEEIDV